MSSTAAQDYVKAIYQLRSAGQKVTTSALAGALRVSPASATGMMKKLAAQKLVRRSPYHGVELTAAGEKMALEIIRHHRLIELFLQETLNLPWDQVHAEAEKMEHVLSEELEDRIAEKLGDPAQDPHGDPIPSKTGEIEPEAGQRLSDLAAGQVGVVRRVGAQEPEQLRYLGELGLTPNARVQVLEQLPFRGPLRVRVGTREHVLDGRFAQQIWVSPGRAAAKRTVRGS